MARLDAGQSQFSRHMKVLPEVGLVLDRRDAQWVRYRRNPDLGPGFAALIDAVLAAEVRPRALRHDLTADRLVAGTSAVNRATSGCKKENRLQN